MVRSDPNLDQKNEKASEGLIKSYRSHKKNKRLLKAYQRNSDTIRRLLKAYQIHTEVIKKNKKKRSFGDLKS